MLRQKEMIAGHYRRLASAGADGAQVAYTFVPGNLTELLLAFDVLPVLPEINALQSGMRGKSADYIAKAEKLGHSEDVCTYVKCDIGMSESGNIGPTGEKLPNPDLLLLSYTGCFTFMKWFELLRERYGCPSVMLHVPYQGAGRITPEMKQYVVSQLERAGCDLVDDDLVLGSRWLRADVPESGDPIEALVHAFLADSVAAPVRYIGEAEKGAELVDTVHASGAEGVVFCAASFCDPALLDQPMLQVALERAGIPYTSFKFSEDTGQFQVIREQAGTFSDSIKLWSEP